LASRYIQSHWRVNERIQAQTLRVIDSSGKQLGVFSKDEALQKAQEAELDLVEIAPTAKPPVAKIIDFAKFRYQQDKKEREAKLKEKKGSEQKEIWLTPFMAENDYQIRLSRIKEFLGDGHKVRIAVRFTGRQLSHREFGFEWAKRVQKDTEDMARVDSAPKFIGRQLLMTIAPVKNKAKAEEKVVEVTETTSQ
jgi:translation initiation factor IF-3